MAKRHRELLARLDPVGLNRYQITEKDIRTVEKYLAIIQYGLKTTSTWQELVRSTVMRVRVLQRKDEEGQWYDDAYALEKSDGRGWSSTIT